MDVILKIDKPNTNEKKQTQIEASEATHWVTKN